LQGRSRELWGQFAAALAGIATAIDTAALVLLVTAYATYLDATEKIAASGSIWLARTDGRLPIAKISPWQRVASDAWRRTKEMLSEFGLTPASQTRVAIRPPTGDGLDEFLARQA
jgi:P27 family predicted phage terminase small subunit